MDLTENSNNDSFIHIKWLNKTYSHAITTRALVWKMLNLLFQRSQKMKERISVFFKEKLIADWW